MIDYIIVRRRDLQDLHSARTKRGADCWTKLALKISPKAKQTTLLCPKRLDVSKLYSPETKSILMQLAQLKQTRERIFKLRYFLLHVKLKEFPRGSVRISLPKIEEINALLKMKRHFFLEHFATKSFLPCKRGSY